MDTIRSLPRQGNMSPKSPTNAPIELQRTPRTAPSQTPTPTKLYPAPLFSTASPSRLPILTRSASTSTFPSATNKKTTLEETQQREEYLIEQYTSVLDTLEAKHLEVGKKLMETAPGSFEDKVLRAVMDTLRQGVRENERHLEAQRRELWADFETEEEEEKGKGSESEEKGEEGGGGVDEMTEGVKRVGWPSS